METGIKVLVPYTLSYEAGVSTVLREALPHLVERTMIEYAELSLNYRHMDEMRCARVPVRDDIGVGNIAILSSRSGLRRVADVARKLPRLLVVVARLRKWFAGGQIVYVHSLKDIVLSSFAIWLLPRPRRPKLVWHCHGLGNTSSPILRWAAKRPSFVIAVSATTADQLSQLGVAGMRILTVPNAVDEQVVIENASRAKSSFPEPNERHVLLLPAATVRRHKGVHVAVQELSLLQDCELWISGESSSRRVEDYVREVRIRAASLQVDERVHWIGFRRDIHALMRQSKCVIIPSLVEPFGLVAVEAMVLGVPVVASRRGGLQEIITHGKNGLLFDPDRTGDMARQVRVLLDDPELQAFIVSNAKQDALRRFGYQRWAQEVLEVFSQALTS